MKTGAPGWARSSREPRSITTGGRTTDSVVWVGFAAVMFMAPHAIERAASSAAPARASGARNDPKPVDCWIERVEADILSSLSTDRRSLSAGSDHVVDGCILGGLLCGGIRPFP